jgi:DNA processing protein
MQQLLLKTYLSGLAYGIDAISHNAVVETKGTTIAVLGGGLARIHPQDHISLAKNILETGGAIISEFPMEFTPNRWSFPMRNRIISGLSQGLLVVEAGLRSGSLITAKCALEQGRTVFAVPGEADNPQAKGTNQLIKDGAKLTTSFDDILGEFEFLPGLQAKEHKIQQEELKLELPEEEQTIISVLKAGALSADQLSTETNLPPGALLALLMKLEMKKLITQLPGKRFEVRK